MELSSLANSWVDSYLEALLTTGLSTEYSRKASEQTATKQDDPVEDTNIAAKYYINQIMAMDEASIQQAWLKVSHKGRLSAERDARLEQLSWRVWGMKRKKAMLADQNAQALAELSKTASLPTEEDQHSAVDEEELSKLYSPNLRLNVPARSDSSEEFGLLSPTQEPSSPGLGGAALAQVESALNEARVPKLYCVLISMHGLVRGQHMELGKDPDTGGQVKYVVEYAKALARHPAVHRVDLLTRLIRDPQVHADYGKPEEALEEPEGQLGGAYIVRLPAGPTDQYLKKEDLWPYIREFADHAIEHVTRTMGRLMAAGEPCELYDIHGHYADAGEAAALISCTLGADMVLTGHSLGRNKLEHLLKSGNMSRAEIESTYAISRRIEGEERALDAAVMVFTSTHQEVKDQWGLYDGYDPALERVVRQRFRKGRHFPLMTVIPPGLDFSTLKVDLPPDPFETLAQTESGNQSMFAKTLQNVYGSRPRISAASSSENLAGGTNDLAGGPGEAAQGAQDIMSGANTPRSPRNVSPHGYIRPDPPIWQEIFRFLRNPRKPVILAMSRPDAKKNITTLVKAYGSNKALREIANLVLIMGNREIIDSMAPGSQKVLGDVLRLIDQFDLYGSVAYPKHHTQADISDIYLLPAATRGVFVNIALQEPFGLTLIEAAAHGVPIVATTNGGPVDIINTLHNGILVEPTDARAVSDALLQILMHPQVWEEYSGSGHNNIMAYSWPSHCRRALVAIESEKQQAARRRKNVIRSTFSSSLDDFQLLGTVPPASPGRIEDATTETLDALTDPDTRSAQSISIDSALDSAGLREDSGLPGTLAPSGGSGIPPRSPRRSLASSSMPLDAVYPAPDVEPVSPRPKTPFQGQSAPVNNRLRSVRDKYVVFMIDSAEQVARLSGLMAKKGKALLGLASGGQKVGLGVASAYSLAETGELLKQAGLQVCDLDFCVTNAGAEIWYCNAEGEPQLDEGYMAVTDDKWDKVSVRRVLAQILAQRSVLLGPNAAKSAAANRSIRPRLRVHTDTAPHHLLFELGAPPDGDNSDAAKAVKAVVESPDEQLALLDRIRRRFRRSGLRTQMTAHLDGEGSFKLHITPLRASRALALRYMAHKHKVDLGSLVLVCTAAAVEQGEQVARFATSDHEDLVAGVQGVLLVPPPVAGAAPAPAGPSEARGPAGYAVEVGLYMHDDRVQLLSAPAASK